MCFLVGGPGNIPGSGCKFETKLSEKTPLSSVVATFKIFMSTIDLLLRLIQNGGLNYYRLIGRFALVCLILFQQVILVEDYREPMVSF